MGIAALVIGIIAVLVGFIPILGYLIVIPALIGIALGLFDIAAKVKNSRPRSEAIAGVMLNSFALFCIALWTISIAIATIHCGDQIRCGLANWHDQIISLNSGARESSKVEAE